MARFNTVPVAELVPSWVERRPSRRMRNDEPYRLALQDALAQRQALVVDLEPGEKPRTVRNRIKRAAGDLGLENLVIFRRRRRLVIYQAQGITPLET